jgi:hypothetical protein
VVEFGVVKKKRGKEKISGRWQNWKRWCEGLEALIPLVTGEFPVTEFGLREKKKMELNKEHFTEKLRKHRN